MSGWTSCWEWTNDLQFVSVILKSLFQFLFSDLRYACVDVFTNSNLIPQVADAAQLSEVLTETFRLEEYYVAPSEVQEAGVPLDGAERAMASLLG